MDRTDLASLLPDPAQRRQHTEHNLDLVALSLSELGAARSIVVNETSTILAGNATVQAAQQAGITGVRVIEAYSSELIVVRRNGLSPEQKRQLALLDNPTAQLAAWDTDVLASLAEDTDLASLGEADEPQARREPADVSQAPLVPVAA